MSGSSESETTLHVSRLIDAPAERLFSYWTDPEHLVRWWGPAGLVCDSAAIELRVGGSYRIANRFPDGAILWISGEFEVIAPPHRLVYTWRLVNEDASTRAGVERVTVTFTPRGSMTEVLVVHERIADPASQAGHERGWIECLEGLARAATR
jgi:uncharacterized protein YndB with AHSA1/START domain